MHNGVEGLKMKGTAGGGGEGEEMRSEGRGSLGGFKPQGAFKDGKLDKGKTPTYIQDASVAHFALAVARMSIIRTDMLHETVADGLMLGERQIDWKDM